MGFGDIYDPKDVFVISACDMGGFEASYGTKYTWLRHAATPKEACAHAMSEFSKSGYKPTDLIKSMPEGPMKKEMVSYCREVIRKNREEVDDMRKQHSDFQGAEEVSSASRHKAIEYLIWKCETKAKKEEEELIKNNKTRTSRIDNEIQQWSMLAGRIELITNDAEFKSMPWYGRLVKEMKEDGWI